MPDPTIMATAHRALGRVKRSLESELAGREAEPRVEHDLAAACGAIDAARQLMRRAREEAGELHPEETG